MFRARPVLLLLVAAAACETTPTAPTVIEPPLVPAVATAVPLRWDSADELAAWTTPVSTGPFSIQGDSTDAVIRVDLIAGNAALHGPELDPPLVDVQGVRMRYRWLNRQDGDSLFLPVYLRPPGVPTTLPRLLPPSSSADFTLIRSGAWMERMLTTNSVTKSLFSARYAVLKVTNTLFTAPAPPSHGTVEIDWIEIARSTGSSDE